MKPKTLIPILSLILLTQGCHFDESIYEMPSPGFAMVSASLPDLRNSVGKPFRDYSVNIPVPPDGSDENDKISLIISNWNKIHWGQHDATYPRGYLNLFVDARNSDEYNSWNHVSLDDKYYNNQIKYVASGGVPEGRWSVNGEGGSTLSDFYQKFTVSMALTGPPAYLHLCLNSWDEYEAGKTAGKTWYVHHIVDLNDKYYLPDDPDWGPYLDNKFRFEKPDRFIIYPGKDYTETERKYFKDKKEIFGTYLIEKSAPYPILALILPPTGLNGEKSMTYAFWVVESGFNKPLLISGILEWKFGKITLIRED
jgi:hypothetical protein